MNPQRWAKITQLCNEALSYNGIARHRFLEQQCEGDLELRKEVESLIASYESDPDFLNDPVTEISEVESEIAERYVGQYRLVKPLGQGGMGDVFLAIQSNTNQHVALKLLRPAFSRANLLKRFEIEQRILAGLDHPHISRLLDIGETEDKLPYLVMEYVDGIPITDYCDEKILSIEKRLELFKQVCSAIQYAHQNLVVHRDIKPSNLLVDAKGNVKLLDFGIAKLLNAADPNVSIMETQTGVRLMTPAYASPEQVQGENITTSSDIYSLGVLLYELLTGTRPFNFENKKRSEVDRIIVEEVPTKPSTVVDRDPESGKARDLPNSKLKKLLHGELDNIVLKSLRKEASRRYSSAANFASDVDRFLNGLPVMAQPDSVKYRTSKFVSRHKWSVSLASVLAITLVGFSVLTAWQSNVVAKERDRAQDEARKSAQTTDFMQGLFKSADPVASPRDTLRIRDFLEKGAMQIEDELTGQPELQITMLNTIGLAYHNLGRVDRAETLFSKSLGLSKMHLSDNDPSYKESLNNLIGSYRLLSKEDLEMELLEELLELDRRDFGENHSSVISTLFNLANQYHFKGNEVASDSLSDLAHSILESIVPEDDPSLALALRSAGKIQWGKGELADALKTFKQTLAMERRLHGERNPEMTFTLSHMSQTYIDLDSLEQAKATLEKAIELQNYYFPEGHRDLGSSYMMLADVLSRDKTSLDQAEVYARDGIDVYKKVLGGNETYMIGYGHNTLGHILQRKGLLVEAEDEFRSAIDYYENLFGSTFPTTIERRQDLAMVLVDQKRFEEAEIILKPDYEYFLEKRGPLDNYTEPARHRMEQLYKRWGKPELAAKYPKPAKVDEIQKSH